MLSDLKNELEINQFISLLSKKEAIDLLLSDLSHSSLLEQKLFSFLCPKKVCKSVRISPSLLYVEVEGVVDNPEVIYKSGGKTNSAKVKKLDSFDRSYLIINYPEGIDCIEYLAIMTNSEIYIWDILGSKSDANELINIIRSKKSIAEKEAIISFIYKAISGLNLLEENQSLLEAIQVFSDIKYPQYDKSLPTKIEVKEFIQLGDNSFFSKILLEDSDNLLEDLKVVFLTGEKISLKNSLFSTGKSQKEFVARITTETKCCKNFYFQACFKGGVRLNFSSDVKKYDSYAARYIILSSIMDNYSNHNVLNRVIFPSLKSIQEKCKKTSPVKEVLAFEKINKKPNISIIIPLYKNFDFLQLQLCKFSEDSFLKKDAEIIYVLDSPEDEEGLKNILSDYCRIYNISTKLIVNDRNYGYASSINNGVKYSKAPHLLFLNSDVLPKEKVWLKKLYNFYKSKKNIGILGAKLLYADDSIQHAGVYFSKDSGGRVLGAHLFEGMPSSYTLANNNKIMDVVTGACQMLSRTVFDKLGGVSTDSIIGDFEDIDFCLRSLELELENWYFSDISLYHFQRKSMGLNKSYNNIAWQYNANLFNTKWRGYLEKRIGDESNKKAV